MTQVRRGREATSDSLGLETFRKAATDLGLPLESAPETMADDSNVKANPYAQLPVAETDLADLTLEMAGEPASSEDDCEICPRTLIEAMLFVGSSHQGPLTASQVASLMRGVRPQEIDDLVRELNETYDAEGCPYRIESVGSGYQMVLRSEFAPLRDRVFGRHRGTRLSQAAVDVLAIIAYQQPITRNDVEKLRGKPSGSILNQLLRRQLVVLERETDGEKISRYRTTSRFLELFKLSSLSELPYSQEGERDA